MVIFNSYVKLPEGNPSNAPPHPCERGTSGGRCKVTLQLCEPRKKRPSEPHRFTIDLQKKSAEKPMIYDMTDMIWYEKPRKIYDLSKSWCIYIYIVDHVYNIWCMYDINVCIYIYIILYYIYNHDLLDCLLIYQMNYVSEWWLFHIAMEDGPFISWWWTLFFKNADGLLFATLNNRRVSETVGDLPPFGVQKYRIFAFVAMKTLKPHDKLTSCSHIRNIILLYRNKMREIVMGKILQQVVQH